MATVTGVVDCIRVLNDECLIKVIENETDEIETFIVWVSPTDPSAFTRIMHSMWLSLLRDSLDSGRSVTVVTARHGALITQVELKR
jgi:hypothetical protein